MDSRHGTLHGVDEDAWEGMAVTEMTPADRAFLDRFKAWKHRPKNHRPGTEGDPTPQQVYDQLMKESFAPALREVGMKGSGGRFELPSDTHWLLLGFQKSTFSDSDAVKFTVNLSAISRQTWKEQAAASPHLGVQPKPSTFYGRWAEQTRIGKLTPAGADLWWTLARGDDPSELVDNVVPVLLEVGVPWLRARDTPDGT